MDIEKSFELFLRENNISYQKLDVGIHFSNEGKNYILLLDSMDEHYYRLTLPNVEIPTHIEDSQKKDIMIRLTSIFKVGKVVTVNDESIWFSYEQIMRGGNSDDLNYIYARSIKILSEMMDDYREQITNALKNQKMNVAETKSP